MTDRCVRNCDVREYVVYYINVLETMMCEMICTCKDESISGLFIRQMIPHHRAGINLAENILEYTENNRIANTAHSLIAENNDEIENLNKAIYCCDNVRNCGKDLCEYNRRTNMIMKKMFKEMNCIKIDNNLDCNFIRAIIPYYRGAVEMARTALCYCICEELCPILKRIIESGEREICRMEEWAECMCCR